MSLVEVSPSTLILLKVTRTTSRSIFFRVSPSTAASVVTKDSIVPMLGWIIPEPLAMPPIRTAFPPSSSSTLICFITRSVVMMAPAASSLPS